MEAFFDQGIEASPREDWTNTSNKLISLLSELPFGLIDCEFRGTTDHIKCEEMELPKFWFEAGKEAPELKLPKILSIGCKIKRQRPKERAYKCSKPGCNKSFLDSSSLYKHSQTHGERQYLCTFPNCGKQFFEKAKLRRHVLVHTVRITQGERSYECPKCGKTFALDFNLKTHLRTHTGEKPYECLVSGCRKKFTQSSNLTSHMKVHKLKKLIEASSSTLQFQLQDIYYSPNVV